MNHAVVRVEGVGWEKSEGYNGHLTADNGLMSRFPLGDLSRGTSSLSASEKLRHSSRPLHLNPARRRAHSRTVVQANSNSLGNSRSLENGNSVIAEADLAAVPATDKGNAAALTSFAEVRSANAPFPELTRAIRK